MHNPTDRQLSTRDQCQPLITPVCWGLGESTPVTGIVCLQYSKYFLYLWSLLVDLGLKFLQNKQWMTRMLSDIICYSSIPQSKRDFCCVTVWFFFQNPILSTGTVGKGSCPIPPVGFSWRKKIGELGYHSPGCLEPNNWHHSCVYSVQIIIHTYTYIYISKISATVANHLQIYTMNKKDRRKLWMMYSGT